jgi:pantoate--beta-alanine ligase
MINTIAGLREIVATARARHAVDKNSPYSVALVATMGALHAGHHALVQRAQEIAECVVVSIFVNPLQFGPNDDLSRYPSPRDADVTALNTAGVDAIFVPYDTELYPQESISTRVTGGAIAALYEGQSRPGHFDGVLTVVSKLLNIVQPDIAVFGQKDAQQLFLVQQMVRDLNIPVRIEVVGTEREADGLALSSRNEYLSPRERSAAPLLFQALTAAQSAAHSGIDAVIAAAQSVVVGEPLVKLDYLVVVNPHTFLPVDDTYRGKAIVLIAARVGTTRLIDNDFVYLN